MLRWLIAVAFCGALAACAQNAKPSQMVSSGGPALAPSSLLRAGVTVGTVSGASGTSVVFLQSGVSSADFAEALRATLGGRGMLAPAGGRFTLSAELVELRQPAMGGFEMDVTSTVRYTLTNASTAHPVFETTVKATFTADLGTTLRAAERLQIATEGSMRNNITQFVEQLRIASETDPALKGS